MITFAIGPDMLKKKNKTKNKASIRALKYIENISREDIVSLDILTNYIAYIYFFSTHIVILLTSTFVSINTLLLGKRYRDGLMFSFLRCSF